MGPPYGKLPILFPYHSHIFRDFYGSGMGIVWEAYHKGVPLLGVPENPIDYACQHGFIYAHLPQVSECFFEEKMFVQPPPIDDV